LPVPVPGAETFDSFGVFRRCFLSVFSENAPPVATIRATCAALRRTTLTRLGRNPKLGGEKALSQPGRTFSISAD
jgi:hypothetical protein